MTPLSDEAADEAYVTALLDRLIAREGGYVEHPADPGGATKYGISLAWASRVSLDLNGDGHTNRDDIRLIDPETARSLYRAHFWAEPRIDMLPAVLQEQVLDWGVNAGPAVAIRELQKTVNSFVRIVGSGLIPLVEDGKIGPRTADTTARVLANHGAGLLNAYAHARCEFYLRLVKANPANAAFIKGWLSRASEFFTDGTKAEWNKAEGRIDYTRV
jgi:lysozyme family protein